MTVLVLALALALPAAEEAAPAATAPAASASSATAAVRPRPGRSAVEWQCGTWNPGSRSVIPAVGRGKLTGDGVPTVHGRRQMLRLREGQGLTAKVGDGPLAEGRPYAVDIEVAPEGTMKGEMAGLVQAGAYRKSGIRIMMRADRRVAVEHFAGEEPDKIFFLVAAEPLAVGEPQWVRYEHDGRKGRIFVGGRLQAEQECPISAPWEGTVSIGRASGSDYWFYGLVGAVRVQHLQTGR